MKITLLGTGGPRPDPSRHAAATVIQVEDRYLLFDAGRGVVLQLVRAGIPLERVSPIFLTHHHDDHIGDLADVILTSWLQGRRQPLPVFGPPGTTAIVTALLGHVYDKDIESRSTGALAIDWFPVPTTDVLRGLVYDGGSWRVYADVVVHGRDLDFAGAFTHRWVCLGYRVEAEGKVDTVGKIATEAGAKQLVLTHFRQKSDALMQELATEVARDYDGPVVLGRDLLEVLI